MKGSIEEIRDSISLFYGSPLSVISDCLRSFIMAAPGHDLIVCDFSNIEGRVLAWLSDEDWKLKAFEDFDKKIGPDIYKLSAQRIYKKPLEEIDFWERLIGKVSELALGYQGGVGAFKSMAKVYLVKVDDNKANEIKKAWREAHPKTVSFWYDLERAAMAAVLKKGSTQSVVRKYAKIQYRVAGSFLWCCLPSGRTIAYPYPEIQSVKTPWDEMKDALTYMGENSLTHAWERQTAYGGLLAENVTQAIARDLLANGILNLESYNYKVMMHVHDEIVCEMQECFGSLDEVKTLMLFTPPWAHGLPISAEGYRDKRYRK